MVVFAGRNLIIVVVIFALVACVNISKNRADPEEIAQAHVNLGGEYYRQNRLDLALESLKKALDADPQSVEANSMIALVYQELNESSLAALHFESAIEYVRSDSPLYGNVHNNYGSFLCGAGSKISAEEHFLKAANNKLYKTPEKAYENAGVCAMERERFDEAREYFQKALEIKPTLPRSLFEMAKLQFDAGENMSARAYIQRFHSVNSMTPASLLLSIRNEDKLGRREEVRKLFEQLQKRFPKSQELDSAANIVLTYDQ